MRHYRDVLSAARDPGISPWVSLHHFTLPPRFLASGGFLVDFYWAPWIGLFRDGVLTVPGRDPVERPDLVGFVDMMGFPYSGTMGVRAGRLNVHPPVAPRSPLGYGIWADGLDLVLDRIRQELPDVPVLVAEYGIGTDDDAARSAYLEQGLAVVHDAIGRGIDVRGLFHWTTVDNYEWLHGFDVSFGIIDRVRNIRDSAQILACVATD